jgi:hypothetical protein
MMSNQYYLMEADADEENALNLIDFTWYVSDSYQGRSKCDEFSYYYGHYSKRSYSKRFQKGNNLLNIPSSQTSTSCDEEDFDLIFKVDMKCRKELAPIELLNETSYDENEDGSEAWIYTVQDCSPDLSLKLEIEYRGPVAVIRPPYVYRCLIQQNHTQQGPSVVTSKEDVVVSPIRAD